MPGGTEKIVTKRQSQGQADPGLSISIVIPSFNGLHLLRENLGSVLAAASRYEIESGAETELLVVDDGSSDNTRELLPVEFPQARLISRDQNDGFAAACNSGFQKSRFRLIALLNNDVRVSEDYLIYKAQHFSDPRTFAVTAKVFEWDSSIFTTGGRFGRFRRGFWSVYFNYDVDPRSAEKWISNCKLMSTYAIGGFATYDREKLLELMGFNELLSPFHWEDVDISYRGWKRGWEVHYEPRSVAHHRTSATIGAYFGQRIVDSISFRNRLQFHWINLHSKRYLASHLSTLFFLVLTRVFVLDFYFYKALIGAIRNLGEIRRLRRWEKERSSRTDAEISTLLDRFYDAAPIHVYYNQQEVIEKHQDYC